MQEDRSRWNKNDPWVPFAVTGDWRPLPNPKNSWDRQWVADPVQAYKKMLTYPDFHHEYRPLPNFEASLRLIDWERGRSAVTYWWEDVFTGVKYPMNGKATFETLQSVDLVKGVTSRNMWKANKNGANYSISPV